MKSRVVTLTEPAHIKGFTVVVVMSLNASAAPLSDFADTSHNVTSSHRIT